MTKPVIVQYWHSGVPPDEVGELMQTWEVAAGEGFAYKRFDDVSALDFIRANYDRRIVEAYTSCGVPAMRADFFRICALLMFPGIYVDADMRRTGVGRRLFFLKDKSEPLLPLYERLERGLLFKRDARVANGFIIVKQAQDFLLGAMLAAAVENIEKRCSNNVYLVTGPGIATKWLMNLGTSHPYFRGFEFWTADDLLPYMRMVGKLPYKRSGDHWVNAQQIGSIFTKPVAQVSGPDPQLADEPVDAK
jgi:mannosyltransferase OCH1-like enzyme